MQITLPNGTVVSGVPKLIEDEDGEPLVEFHVSSDGHAGAIEGVLHMRPDTFEHMLNQTERLAPRLTMVQRRLLLR